MTVWDDWVENPRRASEAWLTGDLAAYSALYRAASVRESGVGWRYWPDDWLMFERWRLDTRVPLALSRRRLPARDGSRLVEIQLAGLRVTEFPDDWLLWPARLTCVSDARRLVFADGR